MFIAVATHKKIDFDLPKIYKPVQVNSNRNAKWENYFHDDDGYSIADKNYCYCELTAMYYLWKNVKTNIKGLCHYRRYFSNNSKLTVSGISFCKGQDVHSNVLTENKIRNILQRYDAIVSWPYKPYPITVKEELKKYCYEDDIKILEDIIYEEYKEYWKSFNKIMSSTNISYFNVIICKTELFDNYSKWIFEVLEKVESRTNIESYDTQHKRIFGYLVEVLLNVYLDKINAKLNEQKVLVPVEFVDMNTLSFNMFLIREGIQSFFIKHNLYNFFEIACKVVYPNKYERYLKLKEVINEKDSFSDNDLSI